MEDWSVQSLPESRDSPKLPGTDGLFHQAHRYPGVASAFVMDELLGLKADCNFSFFPLPPFLKKQYPHLFNPNQPFSIHQATVKATSPSHLNEPHIPHPQTSSYNSSLTKSTCAQLHGSVIPEIKNLHINCGCPRHQSHASRSQVPNISTPS